jgi:hypothetical protein
VRSTTHGFLFINIGNDLFSFPSLTAHGFLFINSGNDLLSFPSSTVHSFLFINSGRQHHSPLQSSTMTYSSAFINNDLFFSPSSTTSSSP